MSAVVSAYLMPAAYAIRVTAGGVTETCTATVTVGREYWPTGDSRADTSAGDGDLFAVVRSAILAHSAIGTCSVVLIEGRVRITTDVACVIAWGDVLTTADPTVLGWPRASTVSTTVHDAPSTCPLVWYPDADLSDDSRDRQVLVRGRRESLSGLVYTASWGDAAARREVSWELIPKERVTEEYAGTLRTAWDTIDRLGVSVGRRLRLYDDADDVITGAGFATYRAVRSEVRRDSRYEYRWQIRLTLRVDGLDARSQAAIIWTPQTGAHVSVSPGNYLRLTNPSTLNGRSTLTVSWWHRNRDTVDADGYIMGRDNFYFRESTGTDDQMWLVVISGGISGQFTFGGGNGLTPMDDGEWHHWAVTFNAGTAVIYLDGTAVASQGEAGTLPSTIPSSSADWTIGHTIAGLTAESHDIARVAIWGAAATAGEIAQLYGERLDLAGGAGLALGQPLIWMPLGDLTVGGSVGGVLTIVGSPEFR